MSTATQTLDPAATAQAIAEAEAALAAVEQRIKAGESVTAAELGQAELDVKLARTRHEMAKEAAVEQREAHRLERIAAIRASLPAHLDPARLDGPRQALEAALDGWFAAYAEHDAALADAWNALSAEAPRSTPGVKLNDGGVHGSVTIAGQTYRNAPAQRALVDAARAAYGRHFPPNRWFDLSRALDS
jgi:hypothetical protein